MEVNIPEVLAELTATFRRYDPALLTNDLETLNELFWSSPLVVRFGITENLYGYDSIAKYRRQDVTPGSIPQRKVTNEVITTYGNTFGTTNVEYVQVNSGRRGRQSQVWMRMPEGWRIVSAHVSLLDE
ncbi:MAG TPA: oxalurate catabolism protein HpxZ [Xanthobacteraceae bacterium]